MRFNATYYWIQMNSFIVVNKYLVDSIESIKSFARCVYLRNKEKVCLLLSNLVLNMAK